MKRYWLFSMVMGLTAVAGLVDFGREQPGAAQRPGEFAPMDPFMILGMPLEQLVERKGAGTEAFSESAAGKALSSVDYTETWFAGKEPVKAQYQVSSADPKTIQQITLRFPEKTSREALIQQVSRFLGQADQGQSDPSAPSKYFAHWLKGGVRYDLQDFGDYMEMYILPAWCDETQKYSLPEKTYLIQKAVADVTGDGKNDRLLLLAERFDDTALFMKHIFLAVEDPQTGQGTCQRLPEETDGGYGPEMQLHDFNGDKVLDVFLAAATGGSGGLSNYHIYTFAKGKADLIFSTGMKPWLSVKGKFLDGYKGEFTIPEAGQTHTLDLKSRRSTYDETKLYRDGKLLEPRELMWLGGYSLITPEDPDGDGVYELRIIQTLSGIAHFDTVAEITSILKYQNGQWKLGKVEVKPAGE